MHSFRIINCDFYMTHPISGLDVMYSEFRGSSIHQVPVIRIFGCSTSGVKTCIHIHDVFPYIYIPHDGQTVDNSLIYQLASGLDKTINTSLGQSTSNVQHVFKISLVSGIPMYGYHERKHQFFKIYFYNPLILKKACTLLQNANVLNKIYQPHEAHIPYILQFMIDYNLHGMSFINVSELMYRYDSSLEASNVPEGLILPSTVLKMSLCKQEVDVLAGNILNALERSKSNSQSATNPGIAALWEDERVLRKECGLSSQISDCLTQNRLSNNPTKTHNLFKEILAEKLIFSSESLDSDDTESIENLSVYPAETPEILSVLDASVINTHSPFSSQSLVAEDEPSFVLDEEANCLLNALQDLKENAKDFEDDSDLSQKAEESDDECDLTVPLDTHTTPVKLDLKTPQESSQYFEDLENFFDDSLNTENLKIPQLDGNSSANELEIEKIIGKNGCKRKWKRKKNILRQNRVVVSEEDIAKMMNSSNCKVHLYRKEICAKIRRNSQCFCSCNDDSVPKVQILSDVTLDQREKSEMKRLICSNLNKIDCSSNKLYLKLQEHYKVNVNDLSTLMNNKLLKVKLKRQTIGICDKSKRNKSINLIKKLRCLDGANDSSSEDDVGNKVSKRRANFSKTIKDNSKYTPLKITRSVSPTKSSNFRSLTQNVLSAKKNLSNSGTNSGEPIGEQPISTEILICKLRKTNKRIKRSASYSASQPNLSNKKNVIICSSSDDEQTLFNRSRELKSAAGNKCDTDSNKLMLDENAQISTLSPLDVVDKYDLKSNFVPQPGSSKSCVMNSLPQKSLIWTPKLKPPSKADILQTNIPQVNNTKPFYSNVNDLGSSVEVGNTLLKLPSNTTADCPPFDATFTGIDTCRKLKLHHLYPDSGKLSKSQLRTLKMRHCENRTVLITPARRPPTRSEVEEWICKQEGETETTVIEERRTKIFIPCSPDMDMNDDEDNSLTLTPLTPVEDRDRKLQEEVHLVPNTTPKSKRTMRKVVLEKTMGNSCEISGVSNATSFKESQMLNFRNEAISKHQLLTIMIMELHVETRGSFKPDPELDAIRAVFFKIINDIPEQTRTINGVISVRKNLNHCIDSENCSVKYVNDEVALIDEFVAIVHEWDPDVITGYEIEMASWGYLIERGYVLNLNLLQKFSRIANERLKPVDDSELKLTGRIVLDFWRLLRHEIALQSYTIENVAYHFLRKRLPKFPHKVLSHWWEHLTNVHVHKTVDYYRVRLECIAEIMDHLDLIGRTCELAKLFGIQFYEVFSRGSQFRVESMMLRLAKPRNYIPVSPSVQQKAQMRAPESLPLILEPESKFYADPVIVLDFQSLYPSMIIAYNYCFTTCLGKVNRLGKNLPFAFGATHLKIKKSIVKKLLEADQLLFSPCGVAFVKPEVRRGVLPQMLTEILATRLMVKKSMKRATDRALKRILHSRQLGLKLIANVTYGYTAANFSGRMPAVEVADSVVSKGRETLERAIRLVENTPEWGSRVVYGDTDSLFVLVPGRSREDAFKIGESIANAVTDDNPSPVRLKLEKVYQPCILQTKKRYVGYMYETAGQEVPVYDAKGIETVRRDGCPAVAKMLEKCLKILFDTKDVSLVKKYVLRQFYKIMSGRASIQDLTFARQYRGASGYRPGACVPALELIKRWKSVDKRNEPRSKERVPYVIVNGPPGLPLIRLVRSPHELLEDPSLRPNALYYITKVIIPAINRCFTLIGADLHTWFNELPRKQVQSLPTSSPNKQKRSTISQYFSVISCACCEEQTQEGLCGSCLQKPQTTMVVLQDKVNRWERKYQDVIAICQSCVGNVDDLQCVSLDCPLYYQVKRASKDVQQTEYCRNLMETFPELQL